MAMETTKNRGTTSYISDEKDFKRKAMKRDKEGHYIIIKGTIQQELITLVKFTHPT